MTYTRYPCSQLGNGDPAAHGKIRLMLLGSPPDMVHGIPLRGTGFLITAYMGQTIQRHILGREFIPAVADCRLQGTADSPTSAALSQAEGL